jgi:hypothetical protein
MTSTWLDWALPKELIDTLLGVSVGISGEDGHAGLQTGKDPLCMWKAPSCRLGARLEWESGRGKLTGSQPCLSGGVFLMLSPAHIRFLMFQPLNVNLHHWLSRGISDLRSPTGAIALASCSEVPTFLGWAAATFPDSPAQRWPLWDYVTNPFL